MKGSKKMTMRYMTKEEHDERKRMVAAGELMSLSDHPSPEELEGVMDFHEAEAVRNGDA